MNFLVSSKLLPYNCKTFSTFLLGVSKSLKAPVVKNLDIKLLLYSSISSDILFNSVK